MSLSQRERLEIADIVSKVVDAKLEELKKEIVAGFVECLDWHNDNFANIIQQRNGVILETLYKRERERIEIVSAQAKTAEEAEKNRPKVGFITQ